MLRERKGELFREMPVGIGEWLVDDGMAPFGLNGGDSVDNTDGDNDEELLDDENAFSAIANGRRKTRMKNDKRRTPPKKKPTPGVLRGGERESGGEREREHRNDKGRENSRFFRSFHPVPKRAVALKFEECPS